MSKDVLNQMNVCGLFYKLGLNVNKWTAKRFVVAVMFVCQKL